MYQKKRLFIVIFSFDFFTLYLASYASRRKYYLRIDGMAELGRWHESDVQSNFLHSIDNMVGTRAGSLRVSILSKFLGDIKGSDQ